ncbi:hypothetical protein DFR67_103166 [Williamsia limnetica]|uniref:Uncharacterized protein n=1 Tax=Williamsia limnetica TaxID=882452 RepID=A0A318RZ82_WILLI|nr:hypothetical protein [Williamsia limnetica]PYE19255.1 hypothetical protein DFR67_103166 [Williamsia limnetica]
MTEPTSFDRLHAVAVQNLALQVDNLTDLVAGVVAAYETQQRQLICLNKRINELVAADD